MSERLTFWGRLTNDNRLVTSEGSLNNVVFADWIPRYVNAFFFVEKRGRKYIVRKCIVKQ